MFGLLGRLFGSDKAVEKTISTATSLLDEAFYTKEEQAADKAEARREAQSMIVDWVRSTQGSNLARRIIALMVTTTWIFLYSVSTLMAIAAVWLENRAEQLIASSQLIDTRIDGMTGAVMIILGFYFAAPYMGQMVNTAMARFGKTTQAAK